MDQEQDHSNGGSSRQSRRPSSLRNTLRQWRQDAQHRPSSRDARSSSSVQGSAELPTSQHAPQSAQQSGHVFLTPNSSLSLNSQTPVDVGATQTAPFRFTLPPHIFIPSRTRITPVPNIPPDSTLVPVLLESPCGGPSDPSRIPEPHNGSPFYPPTVQDPMFYSPWEAGREISESSESVQRRDRTSVPQLHSHAMSLDGAGQVSTNHLIHANNGLEIQRPVGRSEQAQRLADLRDQMAADSRRESNIGRVLDILDWRQYGTPLPPRSHRTEPSDGQRFDLGPDIDGEQDDPYTFARVGGLQRVVWVTRTTNSSGAFVWDIDVSRYDLVRFEAWEMDRDVLRVLQSIISRRRR